MCVCVCERARARVWVRAKLCTAIFITPSRMSSTFPVVMGGRVFSTLGTTYCVATIKIPAHNPVEVLGLV